MHQFIENFALSRLSGKLGKWQQLGAYVIPLFLALAATLIKRYLFADTGYPIPFMLYTAVILISGCFGGSKTAIIALPFIAICALIFLDSPNSRRYVLSEWILFAAEALLIALLFFFIEQALVSISRKEERFRRIIDQSAEGFLLCDAGGRITYNCAWVNRLLGVAVEGQLFNDLIADQDRRRFELAMAKLAQNQGSMILQLSLQQNANQSIYTECCFNNLLADPLVNAVIVQMRDVSLRVDRERQREDFIHMASHELKTPVTAIRGFLQVAARRLQEGKTEGLEQWLDRMNAQTDKILNLVDEMLNAIRVREGGLTYHFEQVEMCHFLRETVAAIQAGQDTHRIDLLLPPERLYVQADSIRLGQVVTNLLTNAIKYSPGQDCVELMLEQNADQARLTVKDYGIGIPQDKLKRVFDRFYRVESLPKGKFAGLGLGLFIAADIIRHHKGNMGVSSQHGEWTQFWFAIPLSGHF